MGEDNKNLEEKIETEPKKEKVTAGEVVNAVLICILIFLVCVFTAVSISKFGYQQNYEREELKQGSYIMVFFFSGEIVDIDENSFSLKVFDNGNINIQKDEVVKVSRYINVKREDLDKVSDIENVKEDILPLDMQIYEEYADGYDLGDKVSVILKQNVDEKSSAMLEALSIYRVY